MKLTTLIIKESILVLMFSSFISSTGGIGLQSVEERLVTILPLLVLFPAINDLTGDFGCIISSKFTTLLYLGKVKPTKWWESKSIRELLIKVLFYNYILYIYNYYFLNIYFNL